MEGGEGRDPVRRKGIILAGGSGTRLHPATRGISKQLLPIYDKPMIYYPLCVLMQAGVHEILVISTPRDTPRFEELLRDGSEWGLNIQYAVQPSPGGVAQAYLVGEEFLSGSPSMLALGDNVFFGQGFPEVLQASCALEYGATIFAHCVDDPERYGIVEFDDVGKVIGIEEKPNQPRSHYAVTGLYFYDGRATELVRSLKPGPRGELEITDLNCLYLKDGSLEAEILDHSFTWLDVGTHDSLLLASSFVEDFQKKRGVKIACPEEVAWRMGLIDDAQLERLTQPLLSNGYGHYLRDLLTKG
ncbi:MAG: glucose-1-phosphate thymidylyltransferase RfbA [Planctomycetes bacterium]|nr:glucose-1-phosphate thymidylyltransferase RfbA [Planctomycetota bacterium]